MPEVLERVKVLAELYSKLSAQDKAAIQSDWEKNLEHRTRLFSDIADNDWSKDFDRYLVQAEEDLSWLIKLAADYGSDDGGELRVQLGLRGNNEWDFVKELMKMDPKIDGELVWNETDRLFKRKQERVGGYHYKWAEEAWRVAQKHGISNRRIAELLGGRGRTDEQHRLFGQVVGNHYLFSGDNLRVGDALGRQLGETQVDDDNVEEAHRLLDPSGRVLSESLFKAGYTDDAKKLLLAVNDEARQKLAHQIKRYNYQKAIQPYNRVTTVGLSSGAIMTALAGGLSFVYHLKVRRLRNLAARRLNIPSENVSVAQIEAVFKKMIEEGSLSQKKVQVLASNLKTLRRLLSVRKRFGWGAAALATLTAGFGAVRAIKSPKNPGQFNYDLED